MAHCIELIDHACHALACGYNLKLQLSRLNFHVEKFCIHHEHKISYILAIIVRYETQLIGNVAQITIDVNKKKRLCIASGCHFRVSIFKSFSGGACPMTPLA